MINVTSINELMLIDKKVFKDSRGDLLKPFSVGLLTKKDFRTDFKEVWFTRSRLNVIRAMHFQMGENPSEKLVSVISGRILDVIIDLRPISSTFKKVFSIELTDTSPSLYIPIGCAHGYRVLEESTLVMYMGTEVHSPVDDIGIHWSSFGFNWDIADPIISERDQSLPSLDEYLKSLT